MHTTKNENKNRGKLNGCGCDCEREKRDPLEKKQNAKYYPEKPKKCLSIAKKGGRERADKVEIRQRNKSSHSFEEISTKATNEME